MIFLFEMTSGPNNDGSRKAVSKLLDIYQGQKSELRPETLTWIIQVNATLKKMNKNKLAVTSTTTSNFMYFKI